MPLVVFDSGRSMLVRFRCPGVSRLVELRCRVPAVPMSAVLRYLPVVAVLCRGWSGCVSARVDAMPVRVSMPVWVCVSMLGALWVAGVCPCGVCRCGGLYMRGVFVLLTSCIDKVSVWVLRCLGGCALLGSSQGGNYLGGTRHELRR